MIRLARLVAGTLLLGLVAAMVAAAAQASPSATITETGHPKFPDRSYVLTLPPGVRASPGDVHVFENGEPVSDARIFPMGGEDAGDFAVGLVIDESLSMRGRPAAAALSAARDLVARRDPRQPVGIVTFSNAPNVLLPLTTDARAINLALARPPVLAEGTHIYDAVDTAIGLLRDAGTSAGAVVVLSDGADTGSESAASDVADAARAAHVRIFSVGLRSHSYDPKPLAALAEGTGGEYAEAASPADLARIYRELGVRLAHQYALRYRSLAGPGLDVRVTVRVDGVPGAAVAGYTTPKLPAPPQVFHQPAGSEFWVSAIALVAFSSVPALLAALAVLLVVRPRTKTLRRRMAQFVAVPVLEAKARNAALADRLFEKTERSLERSGWLGHLTEELELAGIRMRPLHVILWTAVATVAAVWLLYLLTGFILFALFGFGVPFVVRGAIKRKLARARKRFAEQLPDNLQVLASALRAGHSFVGALSVVVDDAPEPARSEFRRVVADEQLGVPIEDALQVVVRRMDNRDLEQVAVVAALQRQTGSNSAEVLDQVASTIRQRFELRRMVAALTAQGRMARWIVSLLPVALVLVLTVLSPGYMSPLFGHTSGRILLFVAAIMIMSGSLVIKKIVNIRV